MTDPDHLDEGFFWRYRELLDAEDAAFDELEHAYEEGDRALYEQDLAQWRAVVERRVSFLDRSGFGRGSIAPSTPRLVTS